MTTQTKRINKNLIFGWMLIVMVLAVSYIGEVAKKERTLSYLLVFLAVTVIPAVLALVFFLRMPDSPKLRYHIVIGYSIMYVFVLLTGSTSLVFVYILPMLSLLVLYHDPGLIVWTGAVSLVFNLASIAQRIMNGEVTTENSKEVEIQFALLVLCFLGSYLATRIYDTIHCTNENYAKEIVAQKEELYQQTEELTAINEQLNQYSEELTVKNEQMRLMTMQTIMTIANTIDAKDEYTRGHSRRVAEYAVAIAKEMGYSEKKQEDVRFIGLLHDIGKIGVPDSVLNKPSKLTEEEYQLMKDHTVIGGEILKDITMIEDLDVGAKYHHERYDGGGYPEGRKGGEIPEIARIIGVADAYDAMTSNRVYRRHLDPERVMAELKRGNGKQFDPTACEAMIRLIEEKRLPKVDMDDSREVKQASQIITRMIDKAEETAIDDLQLDSLTGTFSRAQGKNVIQEQIARYGKGSVFIVDIDGFKKLNETEGFMAGDHYLKVVADQMRNLAGNQVVSRFGADEFITYLPEVDTPEEAERVADYFIGEIRAIAAEDASLSRLSVCIGVTQIATEKDKVMVAYENANKALYVAKQCGTGSFFCHRLEEIDEDPEVAESADLKQLVGLLQNRERYRGGYTVAFPEFGKVYDFISNLAERNRQQVHIVLFTIREIEGASITIDERDQIMGLLEKAIVRSIRNVDATTRYSNIQRVVLLMNLNEDQTRQVINRIMADFYRMYDRKDVEIHYDSADLSRVRPAEENGEG
ncbi:MAG: diguanylate cyclase [Lachnospiraceae bacterium]|nr:diguanylate cyclase [Lachnospiraceae bacterium]